MKILCLFFLLIGVTFSKENGPGKKGSKGDKHKRDHGEMFLNHFDGNKDGEVTREEFKAGRRVKKLGPEVRERLFERLDKNGDGVIQRREVKQPPRGKGKPRLQMREILKKADRDRDGRITFGEFREHPRFVKMPEKRSRKLFDRIDRNRDGVIDPSDRRERKPRPNDRPSPLMDFDLDKDGGLSLAEFKNLPQHLATPPKELQRRFDRLDSNRDGSISKGEAKKGLRMRRGDSKPKVRRDLKK